MPREEDYPSYRSVAQAGLGLLLLILTGACTWIFSSLNDNDHHLAANDRWMQQIQDTQNEYAWRVQKNETAIDNLRTQKAEQAEVADLKAQLAATQSEVTLDREALHDLSDSFTREYKHNR